MNNLISGLIQNGHEVSVYSLDARVTAPLVLKGENLTVFFAHFRPRARPRMLDMFRQEAAQIKKLILDDQPDIVHAQWTYEYALGAVQSGMPHLITFRDDAWEVLKLQRDLYRVLRFALDWRVRRQGTFFNVNSIYLRDKLAGFKKDLPVVPNSVDDAYLAERGQPHPSGVFKIVSIANNWSKLKNVSTALKAFKLLRQKYGERVEYHLVGNDFRPGGPAEQWAIGESCAEGVVFRGRINHASLVPSLSQFAVLLHPSLEESFGNTLVEAMGCGGIPVVGGKDSGAVPWVLDYGERGLLVDVTAEQEIADALERLVLEADLYNNLSEGGIAYVRERFGARQIAHRYEELYRQVLQEVKNEAVPENALMS